MLSFIVIGRNEGWKLTKCFESIFNTIEVNNLVDFEIIYIDSDSIDDSIERAKKFSKIMIFKLTGECNAAIGRNIGVKVSKGNVLFFIDGDMEIIPNFLPLVFDKNSGLKYKFVSGQLKNFNYDKNGIFINNTWQYKAVLSSERYYSTTGGIFIIKRELWENIDGMNIRFKTGEDLDLSLRLTKKGHRILRKSEIIAFHHTVQYQHNDRIWNTLFSGNLLYSKSLLYRKHFFNKNLYTKLIKTEYSLFFLILLAGLIILFDNYWLLLLYLLLIIVRILKSNTKSLSNLFQQLIYLPLRDLLTFLGFFFFYPKKPKDITYKQII